MATLPYTPPKPKNVSLLYPNQPAVVEQPKAQPTPVEQPNTTQPVPIAQPTQNAKPIQYNTEQVLENKAVHGIQGQGLAQSANLTNQLLSQQPLAPEQQQSQIREQMDRDARLRTQAIENTRQQTAGVSGSAERQRMLQELSLQSAQERGLLKSELEQQQADSERSKLIENLGQAREQATAEQNAFATGISGLTQATASKEGEAQRAFESQENLAGRTFSEKMTYLDDELANARANGDFGREKELMGMQQGFQAEQSDLQRQYNTEERLSSQDYLTGERLGEQEYDTAMAYLQANIERAAANGDFGRQRQLQRDAFEFETSQQLANFDHDQKMTLLDDSIAETSKSGDFKRQVELVTLQAKMNFKEIAMSQGFEAGQSELDRAFKQQLEDGNAQNALALAKTQMLFQAEEAAKNRIIQEKGLELEEKGIDFNRTMAEYSAIMDQVDSGLVKADAATEYLNSVLGFAGLEPITAEERFSAEKGQIEDQWELKQSEYVQSHPEYQLQYQLTQTNDLMEAKRKEIGVLFGNRTANNNEITRITQTISDWKERSLRDDITARERAHATRAVNSNTNRLATAKEKLKEINSKINATITERNDLDSKASQYRAAVDNGEQSTAEGVRAFTDVYNKNMFGDSTTVEDKAAADKKAAEEKAEATRVAQLAAAEKAFEEKKAKEAAEKKADKNAEERPTFGH